MQPSSPASKAGLVSFFDFIVGANGMMLLGSGEGLEEGDEYDDVDFPALLQENKGKVVELCTSPQDNVWNAKGSVSQCFCFVNSLNCSGLEHQGMEELSCRIEVDDIAHLTPLCDQRGLGTRATSGRTDAGRRLGWSRIVGCNHKVGQLWWSRRAPYSSVGC